MEEGKGLVGGTAEERGGEGEVTICAPDQKEELFHTLAFSLLLSPLLLAVGKKKTFFPGG